ncbi:hypothetical protein MNEG_2734 [Monoraphidium neglectum]|uniref:Uncharacterized protein n=1 Tax=Monoraphidium neglectum TaxID=145388 RepID=A0A0D2MY10_9CHLO|nr:hypothetical protein MNEG_2734 [Monoraphidium neglectum]KIZ05232.1 hypothetical protein MNEG_2734 [Monoraphidium neglectum]|eukprot:XP_013904251.1 hypothetical protein MNEG_2734 [Monoraphidium neglectum]
MGRVVIALAALLALAIGHTCGAATNELRVSDACQWDGFESAVQRFSRIIQFKTVSDVTAPNHVRDAAEFGRMDEFLRGAFPRVFQQLKVEKVGCDSLSYLITWQGSQPDLRPVLFISHLDVVPVAEASEKVGGQGQGTARWTVHRQARAAGART